MEDKPLNSFMKGTLGSKVNNIYACNLHHSRVRYRAFPLGQIPPLDATQVHGP